ncbi:MAG: M28 family peptidase [Candidatus Omnitrophica bacterium]|nr:M28 family peptidase [Candidatus Omnitrophota bacterium]
MPEELMIRFVLFVLPLLVVFILWKGTTTGWRSTVTVLPDLTETQKVCVQESKRIIQKLAVEIGPRNYMSRPALTRAKEYIKEKFMESGYETSIHTFEQDGQEYHNVIAQWPGSPSDDVVLLGAHYDTCFNPGADDNGSGIAGLLLVAEQFVNFESRQHMRFVAFANEEPPFFKSKGMGSWYYVESLRDKNASVRLAVVLEMIGYYSNKRNSQRYMPFLGPFYPNRGNFIAMISNISSFSTTRKFMRHFKKKTAMPTASLVGPGFIPPLDFSDHLSFWSFGYPSLMLTDTAFLRNPNYHTSTDLPETLDYERMAIVITGLADALDQYIRESYKK